MPAYELFLILKNLPRPELVQSIKRGAELILKNNGVIRSFENLGHRTLPYRLKSKEGNHTEGNYMLIKFDLPRNHVPNVISEIQKDADYIRSGITPITEFEDTYEAECKCLEKGKFMKNPFNFEKPMTTWDKKKVYKNYGLRL
ncbi:unnamed protein product [Brachionus calyciflorus]|uniref:Small ribosomal subunit protein bS6m n=1 Tax=Brachionus calyciflorus TaxID=104777 RepID=A0A813M692_9BILA|nr:unnamed protein product [Brachionus calyciflorus]